MSIREPANAGSALETSGAEADRWGHLIRQDRVHRVLYTDSEIFDEEMIKIFGGQSWVYLAHESQVPEANSFLSVRMGQRPVIVTVWFRR